ncbi:serine/threonine protein kinase [Mesorhizobium sp. M0320]|uniref:serine/threonine-protein kinase n=1 Tax=Mesorhizobium sp. M0320 TaxID=2956936 RepID=UPI00333AEF2D
MAEFIANLDIGAKVGNGHFGDVHIGTDAVHGQVAVKILRQKLGETAIAWDARRAGLLAEAASLKKASHKHVVQVHQILETPAKDAIHLVMEYCHGGSLQKAYEAGPISSSEVHKIATEIAHGLCALHERGMIHRDIKPGNILIHRHGHAKLGDFGLVTDDIILGYAAGAGYADHLAPEVWHNGQTSTKTDIWATGITLYRLLHGDAWYKLSAAPKHTVRDGGFADSLAWLPHVSPRWRRLIRAMLNDNSALSRLMLISF